jgi:hypothetical protein
LECCSLETSYSHGHISQVGRGFDVDGDGGLWIEEREKVTGRVCRENVSDERKDLVLSGLYRFQSVVGGSGEDYQRRHGGEIGRGIKEGNSS